MPWNEWWSKEYRIHIVSHTIYTYKWREGERQHILRALYFSVHRSAAWVSFYGTSIYIILSLNIFHSLPYFDDYFYFWPGLICVNLYFRLSGYCTEFSQTKRYESCNILIILVHFTPFPGHRSIFHPTLSFSLPHSKRNWKKTHSSLSF